MKNAPSIAIIALKEAAKKAPDGMPGDAKGKSDDCMCPKCGHSGSASDFMIALPTEEDESPIEESEYSDEE